MARRERLIERLTTSLAPASIEVVDESHRHAGHAGAQPGGETHYHVEIVATRFAGMSRIARHRLVHEIVHEEFENGLHALSLKLLTPDEVTR
jgi:BolA protein